MSFFSSIGNIFNNAKNAVVDTAKGVFNSVILATKGIEAVTPIAAGIGTGIVAGPVAGIAAGVGTGALIGALEKSPTKTIEKIASGVNSVSQFTGNVGGLLIDPSLENAKKTFTDNPVVTSIVGAGAVAAIGLGASSLIASVVNTRAARANTEAEIANTNAMLPSNSSIPTTTNNVPSISDGGSVIPTNTATPITPATASITTGNGLTSTKRKKRHNVTKQAQNVVQKMNIVIQNKNSSTKLETKKYLNALMH
jgi:hypothetical protein